MRRRDFIALGGAIFVSSHIARADTPIIGVLHSASPDPRSTYVPAMAAFREGVSRSGLVEGRSVLFEYRWAEDQFARLPALAADLVQRNVSLIFAGGGDVAALAAKKATTTTPIVFAIGADPVKQGIVASLGRPEANVTGVTFLSVEIRPKMLDPVREILPKAAIVGILGNKNRPNYPVFLDQMMGAARGLGLQVRTLTAGNAAELDTAFAGLPQEPVDAMVVLSDPVYLDRRDQLALLELQYRTPAIYSSREHVVAGGLVSYGASIADAYSQAGVYAARILKGEKPSELPIVQPTKFELVVNAKTAKTLGLTLPATLLARADEVIE